MNRQTVMLAAIPAALAGLSCLAADAALPVAGPRPAVSLVAEIPYRIDYQGWLTVDATVNGEGPYDFIVDSGATITSAFQNLADRQAFALAERRRPIRILGLTSTRALPAYELGDIEIGGVRLDDHVGVVLPDWTPPNRPPQGVLGLDLLTRYSVHIDADRNAIRFYPPDAAIEKPQRWTRTDMRPIRVDEDASPLYQIYVRVGTSRIPCIIDLGATGTVFNTPALRSMLGGLRINGTREQGFTTGTRLNDIFDNKDTARAIRISRLKIGQTLWRNKIFIVYDAEIFKELGFDNKPFCLIGADLLAGRSFIFDFSGESLYIGPEPTRRKQRGGFAREAENQRTSVRD